MGIERESGACPFIFVTFPEELDHTGLMYVLLNVPGTLLVTLLVRSVIETPA